MCPLVSYVYSCLALRTRIPSIKGYAINIRLINQIVFHAKLLDSKNTTALRLKINGLENRNDKTLPLALSTSVAISE